MEETSYQFYFVVITSKTYYFGRNAVHSAHALYTVVSATFAFSALRSCHELYTQ